MSDKFWRRHVEALRWLSKWDPGFWTDLGRELEKHRQRRNTTRGAAVREFRATSDAGTQTPQLWGQDAAVQVRLQPRGRDAATQVGCGGRPTDAAIQAPEPPAEEGGQDAGELEEAPQVSSRRPRRRGGRRRRRDPAAADSAVTETDAEQVNSADFLWMEVCWNCGSLTHFVKDCPLPALKIFCYRCGHVGTTVKECLSCRGGWLAQGPYIPGQGHPGPAPPRHRGNRPGARKHPYQ